MREPGQPNRAAGALGRWRERLRRGRERGAAAGRLYAGLVDAARSRRFFAERGVPDTPEGRFEMIALHVGLVLRRLRAEGPAGAALGQALFDLMFADMDAALRELGIGDLGVGKQVKRLAGQFYARLAGLDAALETGGGDALAAMLAVVYRGGPPPLPDQAEALAADLLALERRLAALPGAALLRGELQLAPGAG